MVQGRRTPSDEDGRKELETCRAKKTELEAGTPLRATRGLADFTRRGRDFKLRSFCGLWAVVSAMGLGGLKKPDARLPGAGGVG